MQLTLPSMYFWQLECPHRPCATLLKQELISSLRLIPKSLPLPFCWSPFSLLTIVNFVFHIKYFQGDWAILILQGTSILGRLILVSIIYRSPTDEQCFLLKLLTKFAAMLVFALALFIPAIWLPDIYPLLVWLFTFDIGLLCMIPVAVLGIQGTAERLPLGLCLLQLVFARGCKAFLSCYSKVQRCCFSQKQLTTQSSSESDSSAEWFYEHFLVGAESYHWVISCM